MPAGTLAGLKDAVDVGADGVYVGFRSATNARNFPGLNLSYEELREGIDYARAKGAEVYVAVNTFPQPEQLEAAFQAVQDAYSAGADAIIASDLAVLDFIKNTCPDMTIHLSVLASACNAEAVRFYQENFGVKCIILPRIMELGEIRELKDLTEIEIEAFAYGVL